MSNEADKLSFEVDAGMNARIDAVAESMKPKVSRSALCRMWVMDALEKAEKAKAGKGR